MTNTVTSMLPPARWRARNHRRLHPISRRELIELEQAAQPRIVLLQQRQPGDVVLANGGLHPLPLGRPRPEGPAEQSKSIGEPSAFAQPHQPEDRQEHEPGPQPLNGAQSGALGPLGQPHDNQTAAAARTNSGVSSTRCKRLYPPAPARSPSPRRAEAPRRCG